MKPGTSLSLCIILGVCAFIFTGCHTPQERPDSAVTAEDATPPASIDAPVPPALAEAFDKMELGNAPTLGPVYRQILIAVYNGDYDKYYDKSSSAIHGYWAKRLEQEVGQRKEWLKTQEEQIAAPGVTEADKAIITREIERAKKDLAELEAYNGDTKKYFVATFERMAAGSDPSDLVKIDEVVTGEKIQGDHGAMGIVNVQYTGEKVRYFVKENGEWKLDLDPSASEPAP